MSESLFEQLTKKRNDSAELMAAMIETVAHIMKPGGSGQETSSDHPGMLLGKIQAGKTRAFIGIIARAFDEGFDFAIILTKGTQALSEQTMKRVSRDFAEAIARDRVRVYDIMHLPVNLTKYHLRQKWVIVAKKEKNNLARVFKALQEHYPDLKKKRLLIIDDEADYATLAFRKKPASTEVEAGKIATWIDNLRAATAAVAFLQVTATPYSLYLQPNNKEDSPLFHPVRPAFTVPLPAYPEYVGGDFFFGESDDPDSAAFYAFHEVNQDERDVLRRSDRRMFKLEEALTSPRVRSLRRALLNFIVGGSIRRLECASVGKDTEKYAFIVHTESAQQSHRWQESIVRTIIDALTSASTDASALFDALVLESEDDLNRSLKLSGTSLTDHEAVLGHVRGALADEEVMVSVVNSEHQVKDQLDDDGQLRLDAPLNIFIGGQILDRGITIRNLIGFYYGRNPQTFQQDTVLQHSRIYGARPVADLAVTRFYTTAAIYGVMRRIHEFDGALRADIESGNQGTGVYFLRRDGTGRITPCSPNKILASDIVTLRAHRRLQPLGFQTEYKSKIARTIGRLDALIHDFVSAAGAANPLVPVEHAAEVLRLIATTLVFEDADYQWDFESHIAALQHMADLVGTPGRKGRVVLFVREGRQLARVRPDGRYSNDPLSYQERPVVNALAQDVPVLALIRQDGQEDAGWRGIPFWWPIIIPSSTTPTTIFASRTRGED